MTWTSVSGLAYLGGLDPRGWVEHPERRVAGPGDHHAGSQPLQHPCRLGQANQMHVLVVDPLGARRVTRVVSATCASANPLRASTGWLDTGAF
jgi:hypothetical protein